MAFSPPSKVWHHLGKHLFKQIRALMSNFPNFQATKLTHVPFRRGRSVTGPPHMDILDPPTGEGCILQHHHPLSITVGGDIPCCHIPEPCWPLNAKRVVE